MTVSTKVKTTLANAESVYADLSSFSLDTQDQAASQMYKDLAKTQRIVIESLKNRVEYIEKKKTLEQ